MSKAWKDVVDLPLAETVLKQGDLGFCLQCFNYLGTKPHDVAASILETVVLEVASRGNWMALRSWEAVADDLPPAARTVITSANAARGRREAQEDAYAPCRVA